MNEYGGTHSTAVDIPPRCDHRAGYLTKWSGIYCGQCDLRGRMPKTWVTRGEARYGNVRPSTGDLSLSFGAFTRTFVTSAITASNTMGKLWCQPKYSPTLQMLSEEVTQRMRSEFQGARPTKTILDEMGSTTA